MSHQKRAADAKRKRISTARGVRMRRMPRGPTPRRGYTAKAPASKPSFASSATRRSKTVTRFSLARASPQPLVKPSASVAPFTYRAVAPGLFDKIMVSEMQSDDAMCRSYPTSMRAEK